MARRIVTRTLSDIPRERIEFLEPGRIAIGELSIVGGRQGLGKSTLFCYYAARVTRGDIGGSPAPVLIAGAEDDPSSSMKPRCEAAGANLALVHVIDVAVGEDDKAADDVLLLPRDIPLLEAKVADVGAKLLTIDPLMSHLDETVSSIKEQEVRRVLSQLRGMARRQGIAIVASMHLNKRDGADALQRITGSGAFTQFARSVFLFDRDPDDPDGDRGRRRALSHEKCNVGPEMPTQIFEVEPILLPQRPATNEPEMWTSRLALVGESARTGKDMLGAGTDEKTAIDEAIEFLRRELDDGAALTKDVQRNARELGISQITLKRAKKQLGVLSRKTDAGPYAWRLPQALNLLDHSSGTDDDPPADDPPLDSAQPSGFEGSERPQVDHVAHMIHLGFEDHEAEVLGEAQSLVENGAGSWLS